MLGKIRQAGIIPVFWHEDPEITGNVVRACYEGGIRVFTFAAHGVRTQENYLMLKKYVQRHLPEMYLGCGGIRDRETAEAFIGLNADYIQSPLLDAETGAACSRGKILWIPGCSGKNDVAAAAQEGAVAVQLMSGPAAEAPAALAPLFPSLLLIPRGAAGSGPRSVLPAKGGPVFIDEGLIPQDPQQGRYSLLKGQVKKLVKAVRTGSGA
jgi:2-dehydro-3-deoxyphosphogluconate aldolase/(4S)-4-hydroxy-2-oxoglutarate aldolase